MSAFTDLQAQGELALLLPGALRPGVTPVAEAHMLEAGSLGPGKVPLIKARDHDVESKIKQALGRNGLCIIIDPPIPTKMEQAISSVEFPEARWLWHITEVPAKNVANAGAGYPVAISARDLFEDLITWLHWYPMGQLLTAILARMAAASEDRATAEAWVRAQTGDATIAPLLAMEAILLNNVPLQGAATPLYDGLGKDDKTGTVYREITLNITCGYGLQRYVP